ncbi:hypothetical protein BDV26DRAFT_293043 [Aspergillus bertholletiae]|uniref:Hydrophobic surface binding protein A-domain-containing protein n=1 Tax=Aspergillus bertholletiae TaxID=1226010 RepID=A0A5N7B636_9EURO|nr:hypothetical protein BDV26DRAFT_293043 [Aspergillus bertholletiae]
MYLLQSLLALLLLTLAVSTSVPTPLTRDATAVINDFRTLSTDLSALVKSVATYNGELFPALDIQMKEAAVERDLEQATRDTTAATPFTMSESAITTRALLGLEPDLRTALGTLVQKKPLVDQIKLGPVVRMALVSLKSKTESFLAALQDKSTAVDRTALVTKMREFNVVFESAIKAYTYL